MYAHSRVAAADETAHRLTSLLSESQEDAVGRERMTFDRLAGPCSERIVLFGAGGLGKRTLEGLRRVGVLPLAFADNNPALWGTSIEGVPVYQTARAAEQYGQNAVFVVTIWGAQARDRMSDRIRQLRVLGCMRVVPAGLLFWKFPATFLPHFPLDLPHKVLNSAEEIRAAFGLFQDEASRREFVGQVSFRLLLDYDQLTCIRNPKHYFPEELIEMGDDEVFVDCGAFDGDSIDEFVRRKGEKFESIIAFEPDSANLRKLHERISVYPPSLRSKIVMLPDAVGARIETVCFTGEGTDQSKMGAGMTSVQCITLDEALRTSRPSLIKFDIEGAELDALSGARDMIFRCRPALAVSAYHQQDHLWRIPLKLAQICENYQYFLRPHGSEGWDLACYAIPTERAILK